MDPADRSTKHACKVATFIALFLPLTAIILYTSPGSLSDQDTSPRVVINTPALLNTPVSEGQTNVSEPWSEGPSAGNTFKLREHEDWSDVCARVSAEEDGFLSHCDLPTEGEVKQSMGAYVKIRMTNYVGRCSGDAVRFHCLEFAARQLGWCNWSRVADASPIPPSGFINRDVCEALTKRPPVVDAEGKDGHKIIFFYPSYGHLEMLKRSITALQHPNHIFLIQVDDMGYADEEFVDGVMKFANSENNICVAKFSYVLYLTASQVLIMWPALAWAEGIQGWTHFFLMGSQTYPIVPLREFRELCRTRATENFFSFSLMMKYTAKGLDQQRRFSEILPYCKKNRGRGSAPERTHYLGAWTDPDGNLRGRKSRIDWLDIQLGKTWRFAKSPGVEVLGASRDLVSFLLHDAGAKMFKQYFTYTTIACEHMVPSIVVNYLPHTFTDRSVCYMSWTKHSTSNKVLEPFEWPIFTNQTAKFLFARKFALPGSEDMLARVDNELRKADVKAR